MAEKLGEDVVDLAATRPKLFAGVPFPVAVVLMMLVGLVIAIMQNPLYELMMLPLWLEAKTIVKRDPYIANFVYMFLRTSARSVDNTQRGVASASLTFNYSARIGSLSQSG